MNDMTRQRAALARAHHIRHDHLAALELGTTVADLISAAEKYSALRTIPLQQVMVAAGHSEARWRRVRSLMLDTLDISPSPPDRKLTVGWVVDPRAGGRRHYAFLDALSVRDVPWVGFPWQRNPDDT